MCSGVCPYRAEVASKAQKNGKLTRCGESGCKNVKCACRMSKAGLLRDVTASRALRLVWGWRPYVDVLLFDASTAVNELADDVAVVACNGLVESGRAILKKQCAQASGVGIVPARRWRGELECGASNAPWVWHREWPRSRGEAPLCLLVRFEPQQTGPSSHSEQQHARKSGVGKKDANRVVLAIRGRCEQRTLVLASGEAPPSSRSCTTYACPFAAATNSGVFHCTHTAWQQ